jgi:uncharacterized iron-regulated membrane protein
VQRCEAPVARQVDTSAQADQVADVLRLAHPRGQVQQGVPGRADGVGIQENDPDQFGMGRVARRDLLERPRHRP